LNLTAAGTSGVGGLPNAITVSMGRANAIGPMSVPASWSAPSTSRISALEPVGLTALPGTDELAGSKYPGVPGIPAVMTRPPAGA
jgi:hypothetical protein